MNLKKRIKFVLSGVRKSFDVRDVLVFGGLAMLGFGLFLLRPWLGFAVAGLILMCFGLFIGQRGA